MQKYEQLTKEQRFQMEVLLKEGISKKKIAEDLNIHRSTIYREIGRNGDKWGKYHAVKADEKAQIRKERYRQYRRFTGEMKEFIDEKLKEQQWSPEQIEHYCHLHEMEMVSHERIYQYIYADKEEGGELHKHLRIASRPYRKRYGSNERRGSIANRVSIEQRPDIVKEQARVGDWEVDTVIGPDRKEAVLTLVERKSLFTVLRKLESTKALTTKTKLINALASYKQLVHTITADNGHEFAEHEQIAQKLQTQVYFTHPYSAWEKGTCENTNGLIRQYIPKKTDMSTVTQEQLNTIANKLNSRPRKKLGYKNPLQIFMANFDNPTVALAD